MILLAEVIMMMKHLLIILLLGIATSMSAQKNIIESLQMPMEGLGKVTIHQDKSITDQLGIIYVSGSQQGVRKQRGYRVQVYAGGNSRVARNEAFNIETIIKADFPDMPVYTYFQPPRWLCRVGDFRSIEEADQAKRLLKSCKDIKEVSVVLDQINISFDKE